MCNLYNAKDLAYLKPSLSVHRAAAARAARLLAARRVFRASPEIVHVLEAVFQRVAMGAALPVGQPFAACRKIGALQRLRLLRRWRRRIMAAATRVHRARGQRYTAVRCAAEGARRARAPRVAPKRNRQVIERTRVPAEEHPGTAAWRAHRIATHCHLVVAAGAAAT